MTQSASWIDRSASSSTSLLEPRTITDTVLAVEEAPVIWGGKLKKHKTQLVNQKVHSFRNTCCSTQTL